MEINLAPINGSIAPVDLSIISDSREIMQVILENCAPEYTEQSEIHCLKVSRIGLKTLTFGFGIGGAVSNIALSLKFGGHNRALGFSVACSNFASRTSVVTWSYHKMIDGEIGAEGKIKRKISHHQLNLPKRIAIKVAVFVIAFLAETPRAYIAYVYNNHSIIYPLLTYISLTATPAYSIDISTTAALEIRNLNKFERMLNQIKRDIKRKISECQLKIIELTPNEREAFLSSFTVLSDQSQVINFFARICKEKDLSPKELTRSEMVKKVGIQALSTLTAVATTAAQNGFYFWIGETGARAVWDNSYFYYTVGALIVASNLYLSSKVMYNRSKTLFGQILSKPPQVLTGNTLISVLMPKTRAAAGLINLGVSSLAAGDMAQTVKDNFEGKIYSILIVMVPLSIALLNHKAISDLVDEICFQVIERCENSETVQKLLKLDLALRRFSFIIDHMSMEKFAKLLIALPDAVFSDFINGRFNKEQLIDYILNADLKEKNTSTL